MLDKKTALDVMSAALSAGGDFAEIFVESCERSSVSMINSIVEKALWGIGYGCGIRVISGFGAIYTYTNDTSPENLIKCAREASLAAKARTSESSGIQTTNRLDVESLHPIGIHPASADKSLVVEKLRQASSAAYKHSKFITQTAAGFIGYTQKVLIANSEGLWANDSRTRTRVTFEAIASNEKEKQVGFKGPGAHKGLEFLDDLDMEEIGTECAETASVMLAADLCPGGLMPVIIDNGFGGVIFHEACGHSLEAAAVAVKASVFADRLGEQIASEKVTAIDDGTIPNSWGSTNIDDEGSPTRKNILIEKGILKSYMIDRLNGLKMGMPATGSSRRESYHYAPVSRMTNTYIASGSDSIADIIASTEYGLYAKKMGGGSVQPATGDFNFAVVEGYMVRGGKLAEPVRGATLIGRGSEVLMNIDMVSDNLQLGQGMCGASSGTVPANVGQPMIRVKKLTVGGRR